MGYPSTKVNSRSPLSKASYYDINNYKPTDRSYAANETYFTANDNDIMTLSLEPQNKTEKTIKTNVYTYSEPQIVEFSNGHKLLVWIDDDADRGAVDRTALYYSFYGGTDWSEPKQVDNDGTADFSPNLKIIGNKAYLAWCNLSTSHSDSIYDMDNLDNDEIKNIFASYEISVAEFDADSKTFAKINIVTENDDYIEMNPVLFGDDNHVEIAWIQNRSDDLFSQGYDYYVMTSEYSNGEWSYPKAYGKTLKAIDSLSAYRYGLDYFAYSVDTDGNQQDYSDKEIYLNHSKITENDHLDAQPVFANNKLYYYSNGQIIEYNLNYGYSNVIIEDIPTDRFDIISTGDNTALVYTKSHGMSNELYAVFYDKNIELWGKPVKLTKLDSQISSYSGIFSENGDMIFALNCIKTSKNDISETISEQTDLVLYQVTPSYDLSVDNINFDGDKLVDGNTLELRMKINNKGELPITEFAVQIINDKNEVLSTTYGKDTIYAGESIDFKAFYPLGDKFMPHDITVKVVPLEVEDFNPSDNCKDVELSYDCLNIENINYCLDDVGNTVIYADIVNRGYVKYDTVNVQLYKNSLAGTKIGTVTINESLDTLDSSRINFEVSPEEDTVYYLSVEKENGSSDFVFLPLENKIIGFKNVSYSNNVINVEITVPQELSEKNPTILIALYKNNKLDRIYQPKSYLDTKCSFEGINDNIDSYMVKVFYWDNLTNCMPLCTAESSNINY